MSGGAGASTLEIMGGAGALAMTGPLEVMGGAGLWLALGGAGTSTLERCTWSVILLEVEKRREFMNY